MATGSELTCVSTCCCSQWPLASALSCWALVTLETQIDAEPWCCSRQPCSDTILCSQLEPCRDCFGIWSILCISCKLQVSQDNERFSSTEGTISNTTNKPVNLFTLPPMAISSGFKQDIFYTYVCERRFSSNKQ